MKNPLHFCLKHYLQILIVVSFGSVTPVQAGDVVKAQTGTNLTQGDSWIGGVAPGSADSGVFEATTTGGTFLVPGGNPTWGSIRILNPASAITIDSGTGTWSLSGTDNVIIDLLNAEQDLIITGSHSNPHLRSTTPGDPIIAIGEGRIFHLGSSMTMNIQGGSRTFIVRGGGTFLVNGRFGTTAGIRMGLRLEDAVLAGTGIVAPRAGDGATGFITVTDGGVIEPGESGSGTLIVESLNTGADHVLTMESRAAFRFTLGDGGSFSDPGVSTRLTIDNGHEQDVVLNNNAIELLGVGSSGVYRLFESVNGVNVWDGLALDGQEIVSGLYVDELPDGLTATLYLGDGDELGEAGSIYLVVDGGHAPGVFKAASGENLTQGSSWVGDVVPDAEGVAVFNYTTPGGTFSIPGGNPTWGAIRVVDPGTDIEINVGTGTWSLAGSDNRIVDLDTATRDLTVTGTQTGRILRSTTGGDPVITIAPDRSFRLGSDMVLRNQSGTRTFVVNGGGTFVINGQFGTSDGISTGLLIEDGILGGTGVVAPRGNEVVVASGSYMVPGESGMGGLTIDGGNTDSSQILTMERGSEFRFTLGAGGSFSDPGASTSLIIANGEPGNIVFNDNIIDLQGGGEAGVYRLFHSANGENIWDGLSLSGQEITGGLVIEGLSYGFTASLYLGDGNEYGESGSIYLEITGESGGVGRNSMGLVVSQNEDGVFEIVEGNSVLFSTAAIDEAIQYAVDNLTPGRSDKERVTVLASGTIARSLDEIGTATAAAIRLPSYTVLDVRGVLTVVREGGDGGDSAYSNDIVIHVQDATSVEIANINIAGAVGTGMQFDSVSSIKIGHANLNLSEGTAIRFSDQGLSGRSRDVQIDSVYVDGASHHAVEISGLDRLQLGRVMANHIGGSALFMENTSGAAIGSILAYNPGATSGHATFRVRGSHHGRIAIGQVVSLDAPAAIHLESNSSNISFGRLYIDGARSSAVIVDSSPNIIFSGGVIKNTIGRAIDVFSTSGDAEYHKTARGILITNMRIFDRRSGVNRTQTHGIYFAGENGILVNNDLRQAGTEANLVVNSGTTLVRSNLGSGIAQGSVTLQPGQSPAARVQGVSGFHDVALTLRARAYEAPRVSFAWEHYFEFNADTRNWDLVFDWRTDPGQNIDLQYIVDQPQVGDGNYSIPVVPGIRDVVIRVLDQIREKGADNPDWEFDISGLEDGTDFVDIFGAMPEVFTTADFRTPPGNYPLIVDVSDFDEEGYNLTAEIGVLTITEAFHFSNWARFETGENLDPDETLEPFGLSAIMVFATGIEETGEPALWLEVPQEDEGVVLMAQRRAQMSGVHYVIEESEDLENWTTFDTEQDLYFHDLADIRETLGFILSNPPEGRFFRLRVNLEL